MGVTSMNRFSLLKEARNSFLWVNPSVDSISARTRGVAVAVNAMHTAEGNYVPREVRTPVPVSAEVVASGEGRAAVVEGLPVSVRLAPVLLVDGEPVDGAQPPVDPVSVRVESFAAESVAEMGGEILAFGV